MTDLTFRIVFGTGLSPLGDEKVDPTKRVFIIASRAGDWIPFVQSLHPFSVEPYQKYSFEPLYVQILEWFEEDLKQFLFSKGYSRVFSDTDPSSEELSKHRNPIRPRTLPLRTYRILAPTETSEEIHFSISPNFAVDEWFSLVKDIDPSANLVYINPKYGRSKPQYFLTVNSNFLQQVKNELENFGYTRLFLNDDPTDQELADFIQTAQTESRSQRVRSPSPRSRSPSPSPRSPSPSPRYRSPSPPPRSRSRSPTLSYRSRSPSPRSRSPEFRSPSPELYFSPTFPPPLLPHSPIPRSDRSPQFSPSTPSFQQTMSRVPPPAPRAQFGSLQYFQAPLLAPKTLFPEREQVQDHFLLKSFNIRIGRRQRKLTIHIYDDKDIKFGTVIYPFLVKCFESQNIGYSTPSTVYTIFEYYQPIANAMFTPIPTFPDSNSNSNSNVLTQESIKEMIPVEFVVANYLYLYNICTDENFRGYHLQERLLKFAFNDLKVKFGFPLIVYLFVEIDNTSAITLYTRLGFINARTITFYQKPAYLMYLEVF